MTDSGVKDGGVTDSGVADGGARDTGVGEADGKPVASIAADSFRAQIDGRRIGIEFGQARGPDTVRDQVAILLSTRIVLDHPAAARLLSALHAALEQHAARWPGQEQSPPSAGLRPATPSHAEPDAAGERASRLIRLVEALRCPYYHERSFRVSSQALAANRFLLTVNSKSFPGDLRQAVLQICAEISMPHDLQLLVEQSVAEAKAVHFGFEGDGRSLYKVYLERRDAHLESESVAPGTPVLLHAACKWDADAPEQRVLSRYEMYPRLEVAQIADRLAAIYRGDRESPSFEIARSVLEMAAGAMNPEDIQYLEVREQGNERASFDLNVYNAGLQLKDVQPQLARMRQLFGIRPGEFQALYDQVKGRVFGHLAGGTHRDGRDFFNVYYGVQRHQG